MAKYEVNICERCKYPISTEGRHIVDIMPEYVYIRCPNCDYVSQMTQELYFKYVHLMSGMRFKSPKVIYDLDSIPSE